MNRLLLHRLSLPLVESAREAPELMGGYERAGQCGFDGVEVVVGCSRHDRDATAAQVAEPPMRSWAGSTCNAVAADCRSTDVDTACADLHDLLSLAQALGASCLNLALPPVSGADSPSTFARYQAAMNHAFEFLSRILFDAEAAGVTIALEAVAGGCLLSPVEVREFLNDINSPAVAVCLDAGRISQPGGLNDWLMTLTHRVGAVRLTGCGAMGEQAIGTATATEQGAASSPRLVEMDSVLGMLDRAEYEGIVIARNLEAAVEMNRYCDRG